MAEFIDTIETNASNPKKAASDGVSAEQHSLSDQIKFDQYKRNRDLKSKSKLPIRLAKLKPDGAI